jgi:hypothetical protein
MGGIDITGPGNKIIKLADPMRNQYVCHLYRGGLADVRRTLDFRTQPQTQTQA